jgi:hypothetical protein
MIKNIYPTKLKKINQEIKTSFFNDAKVYHV